MLRSLVTEYEQLQTKLATAGRRPWSLHQFLAANGFSALPTIDETDPDLSEVYLKLDGWKKHPTKPDIWIP